MKRGMGLVVWLAAAWGDAWAAEPARCDAVFLGPATGCSLPGEWAVTATGRNESRARKLALRRLGDTVQSGAEQQAARASRTLAALAAEAEVRTCRSVALERAQVSCMVDPMLTESRLCFADLDDTACYDGPPLDVVGVAWKVSEQGRRALCSTMESQLEQKAASAAEVQACLVKCARESTVRCVPR